MNPERAIAYRKQVSVILEAVLAETLTPRAGLNGWPMAGNQDPSVQCAYTMLWYFESDEERHGLEVFYADLQLQTLRDAWQCLRSGNPLAESLQQEYQTHLAPPEYRDQQTWQRPLERVAHWAQLLRAIVETLPLFQRKAKGPFTEKGPFG